MPHTVLIAGNVLASKQTIVAYRIYYFSFISIIFHMIFCLLLLSTFICIKYIIFIFKIRVEGNFLSLVPLESNFFQFTLKLAYAVSLRLISYRRGKPIIRIFVIDF